MSIPEKDFVRDTSTKAILNTNRDDLLAYKNRKKIQREKEDEINDLKKDVAEIKNMLKLLLEKD